MDKNELERIAQSYHLNPDVPDKHIEDLCQEHCCRWLLASLGQARSVLELGYGDGIVTRALVEDGREVTVVEGAATLIERLKQTWPTQVHACHALFEAFDPGAARFDAIIASHVLEHVADPVALLERLRNWLAPGGRLLVVVPNRESLHRRLAVIMGLQPALDSLSARDGVVGHRRVYSLATLRHDIEEAGYTERSSRGFFLKPLANSMMLDYSPQLLSAMNEISGELPVELLANIGMIVTAENDRYPQ